MKWIIDDSETSTSAQAEYQPFLENVTCSTEVLNGMSVFSQGALFLHVAVFTVPLCRKKKKSSLTEREVKKKKTIAQFKNGDEKKVSEQ